MDSSTSQPDNTDNNQRAQELQPTSLPPASPQESPSSVNPSAPEVAAYPTPADNPADSVVATAQPVQPEASSQSANPSGGAGLIVLQWLTYAFWGWAVLALSSLTAAIIANFINKADVGGFMPFAIAALVVLLPVAFICDSFYSKREPTKKTGAAMAVMLIHAVIFALCGVAALITAVVSVFMMVIGSDSDSRSLLVTLLSALIVSAYYAATLARTLNPSRFPSLAKLYRFGMMATVGIIIVLGIVGPVARERSLRDDRLLEQSLSDVPTAIEDYARDNDKLPSNLSELTNIPDGAKKIIEKGLVEYKPNTKTESVQQPSSSFGGSNLTYRSSGRTTYYYELCATFKEESDSYGRYGGYADRQDDYTSYISSYSHPAGRHCYKLSTRGY